MIKNIFFLFFLILTASCKSQKEIDKKFDTHKVISPIIKNAIYQNEYIADIHAVKYVEVRSKVKGYIEKIHIDEGQTVKEGQLLFTLSSLEFEKEVQKADAAYKSAGADLKAAEVELNNVKNLVDKAIVSKAEFDVIKAKYDALKADMDEALVNKEQASLQLSFANIKAPYNGIINRIPKKFGSLIAEGDMLTSISDSREIFAYFNLSEIDYLNYVASGEKQNQTVNLKLANHVLYNHEGKIEMIESEFDHATGNIAFRARFPNPNAVLKHGSHAKVIVNKELKNVLLIPQKSTFEIQDKRYVFLVNKDGVLEQRNVISKIQLSNFYVIESGLSKDEKILFEGVANVKDGDKILPVEVNLETSLSVNGENF